MQLSQIFAWGGGGIFLLLTLVQVSPVKINPWSALARLEKHIQADDERDADMHRARILQFNTELLREKKHTEEDFNEIFYNINCYERYCRDHPDYQNGRAVHAIANIGRVYDDRLRKHDFL